MSDDLVTWLRARLFEDEAGLRTWLANLPPDSGAADWVRQFLTEVDAKRRILVAIEQLDRSADGDAGATAWELLRILALPHADRPGYLQR